MVGFVTDWHSEEAISGETGGFGASGQHNQLREPHGLFPMSASTGVTNLANTASETALEDLNTKDMTTSAKKTKNNPVADFRQKTALHREILKSGWSQLEQALKCKILELTNVPASCTS